MSLLDDVSIVVTPNGYKAGTLYGVIPSSGAADMDVTRATAATRVDENGLVNYAEVLGSEEVSCGNFECAVPTDSWDEGTGWLINGGTATYDGSAGTQAISQSITNVQLGTSCKVTIDVLANQGTGANTIFLGGTVLNSNHLDVGSYTFYGSFTSDTNLYIYGRSGEVFEIDNVSVKESDRNNVPRIDYTGGGCPHILAEPERTNLIPYSEDFNSWHTANNVTITQDTTETTSPSGNNTASKITINSASTPRRVFEVISTSSGSDYTFTLYAKKGTTDYIRLFITSSIYDVEFDLTNGTKTVTSGSGSIESIGNDWYRLQATGTSSLTGEVPQIQLSDSASVNDYLYFWGAQFEEGSYATSYIPTSGSTVTRIADVFTRDGIGSLINSEEGVLFVEMAAFIDNNDGSKSISLSSGGYSDNIIIQYTTNTNQIVFKTSPSYSTPIFQSFTVSDITQDSKMAFKYRLNDCSFWHNGIKLGSVSSFTPFSAGTLTELNFNRGDGGEIFEGKVKQLQVFKTALGGSPYDATLSDARLAALTSL